MTRVLAACFLRFVSEWKRSYSAASSRAVANVFSGHSTAPISTGTVRVHTSTPLRISARPIYERVRYLAYKPCEHSKISWTRRKPMDDDDKSAFIFRLPIKTMQRAKQKGISQHRSPSQFPNTQTPGQKLTKKTPKKSSNPPRISKH